MNKNDWARNTNAGPNQQQKPTKYIESRLKIFRFEDFQDAKILEENKEKGDSATVKLVTTATQDYENAVNAFILKKQRQSAKDQLPIQITSMLGEIHIQYGELRDI